MKLTTAGKLERQKAAIRLLEFLEQNAHHQIIIGEDRSHNDLGWIIGTENCTVEGSKYFLTGGNTLIEAIGTLPKRIQLKTAHDQFNDQMEERLKQTRQEQEGRR